METPGSTAGELVARNVRRIRELRDLKQAQLARRLGWSKQTLSKLETGARNITVDDLLALALVLHVAPVVLMIPDEDDEALRVTLGDDPDDPDWAVGLSSAEAYGWMTGVPDPTSAIFMYANQADYFGTTPSPVMRRYGARWLREVREEHGWTVSDDGTVVDTGGTTVQWRPDGTPIVEPKQREDGQ